MPTYFALLFTGRLRKLVGGEETLSNGYYLTDPLLRVRKYAGSVDQYYLSLVAGTCVLGDHIQSECAGTAGTERI